MTHRALVTGATAGIGNAFAKELAKRGLAQKLLAEVNRQLDARGLILRRGTLIDATILEAAVRPPAGDAGEVSFPRRCGRVVKVDLFRPGDPCPRRDVGSQASSRARR